MTSPPRTPPNLNTQFTLLASTLGASPSITRKWSDLIKSHYTEPHRHYHNLSHITSMLENFQQYQHLVSAPTVLELAIFFHDIIYDPRRTDNEVQSIRCFEEFVGEAEVESPLEEGEKEIQQGIVAQVAKYIERTITHTLPLPMDAGTDEDEDSDLCLFLDLDLEVLGRSEAEYETYARQIREEYAHFGEREYCAGRIKVLRGFLSRDRLFFSELFYTRCEVAARRNLAWEIGVLEGRLNVLEGA